MRWFVPLAFFASIAASRAAHAESAGELFDAGLRAFLAGDHQVGCPKLQRSYDAEPLLGVLFTLAECQAGWGKLKTAHDSYRLFSRKVAELPPNERRKHTERLRIADSKSFDLARRAPSLSIGVRGALPAGARVTLGARDVTRELGQALLVDPGRHDVQLLVDGQVVDEKRVAVAEGVRGTVEVTVPATTPRRQPGPDDPEGLGPADDEPSRVGVYTLGAVGIVGLAVGSVTGFMTLSKKSTIEDNCPNRVCNEEGRAAADSAQQLGTISTVGFGVGASALVAAAILHWSTSGSSPPTRAVGVSASPTAGSVVYSGWF